MHLPNVFLNFIQCPYVVPHAPMHLPNVFLNLSNVPMLFPMHLPNVFLNFIQCICQMFLMMLNCAFTI
jgi:hypothetical protein